MKDIDLFFETPALLLAAIPAAACIAAFFLMRREKGLGRADRAAAVLRVIEVLLLVVIAAGPCVTLYSNQTETVILADRSGSMTSMREEIDAWIEAARRDTDGGVRVMDFAAAPVMDGSAPDAQGTNIAAAIDAAAASFAGEAGRRIVLFSDGVATDGDALAAAQAAGEAGIRLDAVQARTVFLSPQAEVTAFELPYEAMEGRYLEAAVTVLCDVQTQGMLRLYDGETLVHEQSVDIAAGQQVFSCALKAEAIGSHVFSAELTVPGDTIPENDRRSVQMNVVRAEKILLVDGMPGESEKLAQLLREDGMAVTVVDPETVPQTVAELCEYALIALMNVNVHDLPDGWDEILEKTVSEYGRSVLTTGSENTYIYGGMKDSPYEALLPVKMSVEERESVEPVALMLVIDTTDSMLRESAGVPIDMAKRGAIKCIDELNGNDYAGVITFSDDAQLIVEMTAMRDKEPVLAAVNAIETASPDRLTKFTAALRLACDTLKEFEDTQRKHVMFITDGSPADEKEGFKQIAQEMRASGITLSTIVVGRIVNVVSMLEELAVIGSGRCYPVESGKDLSDIMSVDSVLSQVEYTIDAPFKPQRGTYNAAFAGEEEITQLFGYIRTAAKGDADVLLKTPEGRPVYAKRNVGTGVAASFMSDLSGDWSRAWYANEKDKAMILRMIRDLLPQTLSGVENPADADHTREYELLARPDGGVMLMEMCARTGGAVFGSWEEANAVELPPVGREWDPVLPLAAAVMLCLLADIALRRLKPKGGTRRL
ncbi:MAG: VWA domain-containing protein [Clostridia bacterium]|nr:VWA domain-containing protein [Clostridia bacterium]